MQSKRHFMEITFNGFEKEKLNEGKISIKTQ